FWRSAGLVAMGAAAELTTKITKFGGGRFVVWCLVIPSLAFRANRDHSHRVMRAITDQATCLHLVSCFPDSSNARAGRERRAARLVSVSGSRFPSAIASSNLSSATCSL